MKRHSLKIQMAVIFIIIMASTLLIGWVINNVFLEDYYILKKQDDLVGTYNQLNRAASENNFTSPESLGLLKVRLQKGNISMYVVTPNGGALKYCPNEE